MNVDLTPFAQFGFGGVLAGAAVAVVVHLIRRGVRVKFEAEIPPPGMASERRR